MKTKVLKIAFAFIIMMIFLTIFSRIADDLVKANVLTTKYIGTTIDHSILENGVVSKIEQRAIITEPNQRISRIYISVGTKVKEGDVLVQLDLNHLAEQITELQREIDKLDLAIENYNKEKSLAQSDREREINRAQEDYNIAAASADAAINQAMEVLTASQNLYDSAYILYQENPDSMEQSELDALKAALEEKKLIYDNAVADRDNKLREAKRNLEDVQMKSEQDFGSESTYIDKAQKQEKLEKLISIQDAQGLITAKSDGVVKSLKAEIGEITSDGAIIIMEELSSESQLEVLLDQDLKDNISIDDKVTVRGKNEDGSAVSIEDLNVTSIQANADDNRYLDVTIHLGDADISYGSEATMYLNHASEYYNICIPVIALRKDADNQYFILIVQEQETILGTEKIAVKVFVEVLDMNTNLAAIKCETLLSSDEIILNSSKKIEDGSRIKVGNNDAD